MRHTLERGLLHAYTLALLLGILTIVGAPFHQASTRHANVVAIDPVGHRAALRAEDAPGVQRGDVLPVFRFNPTWKREIGHATVDTAGDDRVWVTYDPARLSWPMGRQGLVATQADDRLTLDFGSDLGLQVGQELWIYDQRELAALARVQAVRAGAAEATVTRWIRPGSDLTGAVATEFNIPTQLAWFAGGWRAGVEWAAIGGVLALWLWSVVSPVPGGTVCRAAAWLRSRIVPETTRLFGLAVLGVPAVWAGARISWYGTTHVLWTAIQAVRAAGVPVPVDVPHFTDTGLDLVTLIWAGAWYGTLAVTRRNPGLLAWNALRYRVPDFGWVPGLRHGQVNWILHLPIFYAFAWTLDIFLRENLWMMGQSGWRTALLRFTTWGETAGSLGHMLTHLPSFATASEAYVCANFFLFSACIVGCLIGYGHTVLTGLVTDSIRNVDFTVLGWLTTAICYAPLLGVVVWRFMPELMGLDPIVTDGPWFWLMIGSVLLLNLLYTLSIFNLGKRFGVMVDKGLVDHGFYTIVRHPSYTLEALLFVVMELVGFTHAGAWFAASVFVIQYFFRSEREDHFMGVSNPDYAAYRERVPWRYVPGVW